MASGTECFLPLLRSWVAFFASTYASDERHQCRFKSLIVSICYFAFARKCATSTLRYTSQPSYDFGIQSSLEHALPRCVPKGPGRHASTQNLQLNINHVVPLKDHGLHRAWENHGQSKGQRNDDVEKSSFAQTCVKEGRGTHLHRASWLDFSFSNSRTASRQSSAMGVTPYAHAPFSTSSFPCSIRTTRNNTSELKPDPPPNNKKTGLPSDERAAIMLRFFFSFPPEDMIATSQHARDERL